MKTLLLALAALSLTAGAAPSAEPDLRLRVRNLDGVLLVFPPQGRPYPIEGPATGGGITLEPDSIVHVTAGWATFDSDLRAKLVARSGAIFRFAVADPGRRDGLRVSALTDSSPVGLEIGSAKLVLSRGGRVAVYDGGCVEVEGYHVRTARTNQLTAGESMQVAMFGRPNEGLTPGDIMTVNVPSRDAAPAVAAGFGSPGRTAPTQLASNPFDFDPADVTLRNALGAEPVLPPPAAQDPARCLGAGR